MYLGFIIVPYRKMQLCVSADCGVESTALLSCSSHTLGFLVTCGWIWAGSFVLRPRDMLSSLDQHYKASNISKCLLALFLPSLCPAEACLCISFCEGWSACINVCVPLLTLLVCLNTSVSRPTSNQWCQPFDARKSVTQNVHCFLTCFHKTFFFFSKSHQSFKTLVKSSLVSWIKHRYFLILKDL